jgi:hypothetical protein
VNDFGTQSADEVIASPPVVSTVGGAERVFVVWKRSTNGTLDGVVVQDGVVGPEHVVADNPVYHDPPTVGSLQTVASLAADTVSGRVYAPYADATGHDLYLATWDGGWGVDQLLLGDATEAALISPSVFTHAPANGGRRVLGIVVDIDTLGLADNEVFYTEARVD